MNDHDTDVDEPLSLHRRITLRPAALLLLTTARRLRVPLAHADPVRLEQILADLDEQIATAILTLAGLSPAQPIITRPAVAHTRLSLHERISLRPDLHRPVALAQDLHRRLATCPPIVLGEALGDLAEVVHNLRRRLASRPVDAHPLATTPAGAVLITDEPAWAYLDEFGATTTQRLRVWAERDGGLLAVVTNTTDPASDTDPEPDTGSVLEQLHAEYGPGITAIEHHTPSGAQTATYDLIQPGLCGPRWTRLHQADVTDRLGIDLSA